MKKVLLVVSVLLFFAVTQTCMSQSANNGPIASRDTLTNADTATIFTSILGNKGVVTYHIDVTKISGTVAGTITISATIGTSTTYYTIASDTLTNTTGVKAYSYSFDTNRYTKYKLVITTSGTCSVSYVPQLLYR